MRKTIMILGTMLIAVVVLISGSAFATMVYVQSIVSYGNVTNPTNILNATDDYYASLAVYNAPILTYGWIFVDLGSDNAMPNSQDFTVYADTEITEYYKVYVSETSDIQFVTYVGTGSDASDQIFTTPFFGGDGWRYVLLEGYIDATAQDPEPGPDVDAVGWDNGD